MRAVRIVFDLSTFEHHEMMKIALGPISWDFRGIINIENGDLLLMCECISLNTPIPPPGFSISGITIEKHLETWVNNLLKHTILVLRFSNEIFGKYFTKYDLTIMAGTNFTSKGLVLQVSGGKSGIMTLLNDMKKILNVRSITSARGGEGIIADTINTEEYNVLKTAYSKGWYDSPKKTSLRALSKELGMSKSSVANYLNSSEKKVISEFIGPN
ncbi:helix-turn-helix domain-containing protein [Euryarchaeota archaeon]|nr:helix-turn-helix domain-containing protein [Euryarchaeota archaeon]